LRSTGDVEASLSSFCAAARTTGITWCGWQTHQEIKERKGSKLILHLDMIRHSQLQLLNSTPTPTSATPKPI